MEFHGTWSAPISMTRAVAWNSIEIEVRQFRWSSPSPTLVTHQTQGAAATAPLPAAVVPHGVSSESSCPYSHPDTSPQSHVGKSTAPASDRQCSMVVRLGAQMPQSCNDSAEMTVPWSGGSVAWAPTTTSPQTNYWRSSAWPTSLPFSYAADYDGLGMWSVPPPILALAWWGI